MIKKQTSCRVCRSKNLTPYLDLGLMPLSNNLCKTKDEVPQRYPLKVLFCEDCGLSQLSIVIDPNVLFGHYVYRSSISQGYKDHCKKMAIDLKEKYSLTKDSFHIDIAGNDGTLLHEFKQVLSHKALNVDPAENLVKINEDQGIRMFNTFWGKKAAQHIINTDWPKANLITATNVFAHVDNVEEFLKSAKMVLAPGGILVLEFPYLIDFMEKREFDSIYFEHLSYFSVGPLAELCHKCGMSIINISHHDIHGGSLRVIIQDGVNNNNITEWMSKEAVGRYSELLPYKTFAKNVDWVIRKFRSRITNLKSRGYKIAGFAASAKGNVLLNSAGIDSTIIDYIVDQTPEKIGMYSPDTGIEIVSKERLISNPPDYLIILSWNFADEIISKCRQWGYKGKFILPLTYEICV